MPIITATEEGQDTWRNWRPACTQKDGDGLPLPLDIADTLGAALLFPLTMYTRIFQAVYLLPVLYTQYITRQFKIFQGGSAGKLLYQQEQTEVRD